MEISRTASTPQVESLTGDINGEVTLPLVMAVILFGCVLLHLILRVGCGRPSPDLVTFYDEANALNYRFMYVVRLVFGPKSISFADGDTSLLAEVEHSINRVVKIPFTPTTLKQATNYRGRPCAKVFIRTAERYSNVSKLLLYHNGRRGSIIVCYVELQDMDDTNSIAAIVGAPIFAATDPRYTATSYPFGREKPTPLEGDIRPSRNLAPGEAAYLLYLALNGLLLADLLLIERGCTASFCNLELALLYSLYSGLVGFALFLVAALIARYIVLRLYHRQLGRGFSKILRLFFFGAVGAGGVALAATYSQRSMDGPFGKGQINALAQVLSAARLWALVGAVGAFVLFALIGLCIPLAVYFHFIVLPEEDENGIQGFLNRLPVHGRSRHGARTTTEDGDTYSQSRVQRNYNSDEAYSTAQSYVESTWQGTEDPDNTPQRPQQQRNFRQAHKERQERAPERRPREKGRRKKRKKDPSKPAGYAHILATQQKKVRSISQYGSVEEENDERGQLRN